MLHHVGDSLLKMYVQMNGGLGALGLNLNA